MEERITIKEFVNDIPITRNKVTVITLNTLHRIEHGYETSQLTYLDEISKEKFLSVKGAGLKSWEQFLKYKEGYSTIKLFNSLIMK